MPVLVSSQRVAARQGPRGGDASWSPPGAGRWKFPIPFASPVGCVKGW